MKLKNLSLILILLYGTEKLSGGSASLENFPKEKQTVILEKAIAEFVKNNMPSGFNGPRFLVSPQSKNFVYNTKFDIVCVPLEKAVQNLAALEFQVLHELGHSQQQGNMSWKEEELYADCFAASFTTRTKFCKSFIELMKKEEENANVKGYEVDPRYPSTKERIKNINKALAQYGYLKEEYKPKTLLSFIQEFVEKDEKSQK
ncbi:TPA: hypothetical protein DCW54_01885 [Candidatus Dependentiae bacterium]|nr:hypothetical protein [Candidatus Dependentiae bacterium]